MTYANMFETLRGTILEIINETHFYTPCTWYTVCRRENSFSVVAELLEY